MTDYSLDRLNRIKSKIKTINLDIVTIVEDIGAFDYEISVLDDKWDVANDEKEVKNIKKQYKSLIKNISNKTKILSSKYNQKYRNKFKQKLVETGNKKERQREIKNIQNKIEKMLMHHGFIYGSMYIKQTIDLLLEINDFMMKRTSNYFAKTKKEIKVEKNMLEDDSFIEEAAQKFINTLDKVKEEDRIKVGCNCIMKMYGLIDSKKKTSHKCNAEFVDIKE